MLHLIHWMGKCLLESCKQNLIKICLKFIALPSSFKDSRKFVCLSKSIKISKDIIPRRIRNRHKNCYWFFPIAFHKKRKQQIYLWCWKIVILKLNVIYLTLQELFYVRFFNKRYFKILLMWVNLQFNFRHVSKVLQTFFSWNTRNLSKKHWKDEEKPTSNNLSPQKYGHDENQTFFHSLTTRTVPSRIHSPFLYVWFSFSLL